MALLTVERNTPSVESTTDTVSEQTTVCLVCESQKPTSSCHRIEFVFGMGCFVTSL